MIRVMIADDDPRLREALSDLIAGEERLEVAATAADGHEAIALARATRPDVGLIDVKMPGGGPYAARRILATSPQTKLLALSACQDRATVLDMVRAGITGYLVKGGPAGDIVDAIVRVSAGDSVLSPDVQADILRELGTELQRREAEERESRESEARIVQVLETRAYAVHLQPIVSLSSGLTVGFEALARFGGSDARGPAARFEDAHRAGLGIELELVLAGCALDALDGLDPTAFVGINLSPATLLDPRCSEVLAGREQRVVVEVTEHAQIDDYGPVLAALGSLRADGARFAVDDAGAGYRSMRHILLLSPDLIKLDIAITRDIDSDPVKRALTSALVSFAAELDASIIAEGIESRAELDTLRALGVGFGQGFLLGRPEPPGP